MSAFASSVRFLFFLRNALFALGVSEEEAAAEAMGFGRPSLDSPVS